MAAGDGDIMDVIDVAKLAVMRQLNSGPDPELMAVDPKGSILYIANEDDSMVTVMDAKSGEVKAEIPVGVEPEGMGVSPDSKYTVATSESTSMAHVIDNASEKVVANVLVDTRPREAKFTPDGKDGDGYLRSRRHYLGDRHLRLESEEEEFVSRSLACVRSCCSRSAWSSPRTANICSWRLGPVTASP